LRRFRTYTPRFLHRIYKLSVSLLPDAHLERFRKATGLARPNPGLFGAAIQRALNYIQAHQRCNGYLLILNPLELPPKR
jgi:hypothetical protein